MSSAAAKQPALATSRQQKLRLRINVLLLLLKRLQRFRFMIVMNRRRSQQRLRIRQAKLRAFYMQYVRGMETNLMEMLPMAGLSERQCKKFVKEPHEDGEMKQEHNERLRMSLRFYEDVISQFSEEQWFYTFRMSKHTFKSLCSNIGVPSANDQQHLSMEKDVALALYALATGTDFRSIAVLFNVSRVAVYNVLKSFANVLLEKLGRFLLAMPKEKQEYREISCAFKKASNMPALAVGVLGVCQVPVNSVESKTNTKKRRTTDNITLQTVIDDRLLFRKLEIDVKHPSLFISGPNTITKLGTDVINGRQLSHFIVSPSSSYPLRPWIMHPYADPFAPYEYDFNEAIENLLVFRDTAFHRLFSRWHILTKGFLQCRTMERILLACCALHNLLEEREEVFLEKEWSEGIDISKLCGTEFKNSGMSDFEEAIDMRDFLARTISSTEI